MTEPNECKETGNVHFKSGQWKEAIDAYTLAIKLASDPSNNSKIKDSDLATYYRNRAAAYLKIKDYERTVTDCDRALELGAPNDPKALFRRAQAKEALEKYEEAYKDLVQIIKDDQSNEACKKWLERIYPIVQQRDAVNSQTRTKIEQMMKLGYDISTPLEKRKSAINNLLVLSKEQVAADLLMEMGAPSKIQSILKIEKDEEIILNSIRTIDEICTKSVRRTKAVLQLVGVPWFLEILDDTREDIVTAAQHCMQTILNTFSGLTNKPDSKPDKEACELNKSEIDTLLTCMVFAITNRVISGLARDAIMELIIRNCHYETLNWADRFVEVKGLHRLLEVCSEPQELHYESALNVTPSSGTIASVCLARIYENMWHDDAKKKFMEQIDEFVNNKLLDPELESKVRVTVAITALLTGPLEAGNAIFSRDGILQMILAMATTDDPVQQKVACECLVAASSKKDKSKAILGQGVDILKRLYQSKDDGVKVRALVGLCKLGSVGGQDASIRPLADGATSKLADACRRFLIKPGKDISLKRWAAEGLVYLTLDADVKEKLIDDRPALRALIELARTGNQTVVYGVINTFVNLCNAYEEQEMLPEMVELAKFAKQHIPEKHELDDPDFVSKRLCVLCEEGITHALVALCKTQSHNSRELIGRVMNALCSLPELRGRVVQDGGAKALLPLCYDGTDMGKRHAAQALARIGITINPEVAFPGQRNLEVIRPLINLLHPDYKALENFEALMALCNLAQMNETVRQRILNEGGLNKIEIYLMEDHLMLCRAAVQCICNLVLSPDIVKLHEQPNDRVKFLALLCMEEDEETAKAAAGSLAILTGSSAICCRKVFDSTQWLDILHTLIANPSPEVQHRGTVVILNIIQNAEDVAEKLLDTDIMQLLNGLSQLPDETRAKARSVAAECLKAAEERKLVVKADDKMKRDMDIPDVFKEAELQELQEQDGY